MNFVMILGILSHDYIKWLSSHILQTYLAVVQNKKNSSQK